MPFSPHKIKSIFILTTLLLTGFTHYSFSQERTIYQGRFPVPFISVDQFILTPRTRASLGPPASCDTGTIYVDNITSELTVCGLPNVVSNYVWMQPNPPDTLVYPVNLNVTKISVGNDAIPVPPSAFNVLGPIIPPPPAPGGEQNEFNIDLLNSIDSAGMFLKMDGKYNPGLPTKNTSIDINFHVGNRWQDYDGRILYMNQPRQGFAFYGALNVMNMWIDNLTHRVGIGTVFPQTRLDIIGDIETNKIILDQDGTLGTDLPGELKVTYSAGGNGYYAVYAP